GLNLTYETREGMLKHETDYDQSEATEYEPDKRASVEAQIANVADEMAYNAHDLEDGLRAGLFTPRDLEELDIWRLLIETVSIKWNGQPFDEIARRGIIRELIGACVVDVVTTTSKVLEDNKLDSPLAVQQYDDNVVGYSPEMGRMVRQLKDYLYENMYRHYRLVRMQVKAERFVAALFEAYVAEPGMLPMKTQQQLENLPVERVVCDYIAGMTDRYALEEWEKLFDPYRNA